MIYINGDSHSAGAELIEDYCFAEDDRRYIAHGRRAHPEAVPLTFGYKIAQALNQPFFLEAESASSNSRILRTAEKTISETNDKRNLFVIIGWTTWEREEWKYLDGYIQVTASGTDSVPEHMQEQYKQWVIEQTPQEHERKKQQWSERIKQFSSLLDSLSVRHLFFHTSEYTQYLIDNDYKTVNNGHHFGSDAHTAWYKYLLPKVQAQYNIKLDLTQPNKRSIVSKVNKEFKGLQR